MKTVIGYDPGASGGIAYMLAGEGVKAHANPKDLDEGIALVRSVIMEIQRSGVRLENIICYKELVGGFIKKPGGSCCPTCRQNRPAPGEFNLEAQAHRMFQFGKKNGLLEGAFKALGVKVVEIHPSVWQTKIAGEMENHKGKAREEKKRILRNAAQRHYPNIKVTLGTSDALLIMRSGLLFEASGGYVEPKDREKPRKRSPGAKAEAIQRPLFRTVDYRKTKEAEPLNPVKGPNEDGFPLDGYEP